MSQLSNLFSKLKVGTKKDEKATQTSVRTESTGFSSGRNSIVGRSSSSNNTWSSQNTCTTNLSSRSSGSVFLGQTRGIGAEHRSGFNRSLWNAEHRRVHGPVPNYPEMRKQLRKDLKEKHGVDIPRSFLRESDTDSVSSGFSSNFSAHFRNDSTSSRSSSSSALSSRSGQSARPLLSTEQPSNKKFGPPSKWNNVSGFIRRAGGGASTSKGMGFFNRNQNSSRGGGGGWHQIGCYRCERCRESFSYYSELREHKIICYSNQPYKRL